MSLLIPYLCCSPAADAIAFYKTAFGAEELYRLTEPTGVIGHAELSVNGSVFYLSDAYPGFGCDAPLKGAAHSVTLHLVVKDVDAAVAKAYENGAKIAREPKDEFYGYRTATVIDPAGHRWMLNQVLVEMSPEEVKRKFDELYAGQAT